MFIRSGAVFVWEESDEETGIKRWTDGRMWTQSRAKDPFLFYEEKIPEGAEMKAAGSYRFVDSSMQSPSRPQTHIQSFRTAANPLALVKQAYSAWIVDPRTLKKKKWHITAYFTQADLPDLPSPVEDSSLRNIAAPIGTSGMTTTRAREPAIDERRQNHGTRRSGSAYPPNVHYYGAPTPATSAMPYYDKRFPEDQRLIRMLNSQHIL